VKLGNVNLVYNDGLLYFRYRVPGWLGLAANIAVRPVSDTELVTSGTGWLMARPCRWCNATARKRCVTPGTNSGVSDCAEPLRRWLIPQAGQLNAPAWRLTCHGCLRRLDQPNQFYFIDRRGRDEVTGRHRS